MAGYDRLIGREREVLGGLRSRFKRRPHASDFGAMPSIRVSGDQVALIQSPVTHDLLLVKPFDTADVDSFARWVEALRELAHPCLAEIVAFSLDPPQIATTMAMNGSLKEAIEQRHFGKAQRFMDDTGIAIIVCGIVLGMQYIHSKGVVHGGLTPESVLIDENGFPKISGFLPTGAKKGADIAPFARILSELTARDANCVDGP
jgi:serine/threonine protein kinase